MQRKKQELDEFLRRKTEEAQLAGVAVAIRGPEGFHFEGGYGYRDLARTMPPDEDTIFGIASMGKSMAALAVAILAEEGRLSLDAPVADYVPEFRVPGFPQDTVTVRHLATHTAGIPPMEPLEWSIAANTPGREDEESRMLRESAPNPMRELGQLLDYVAHCPYPSLGGPGEYMSYSNEGYAVLCAVVDAAADMSLEEFLDVRVFDPVGMTRTTLDVDGSRARQIASDGNITALFERAEDGSLIGDEQWSVLPPFRASACVKSTAHDMARYYQCLSDGGRIDGRQVLPQGAVERMIGAGFPEQEKAVYCLGLNKRTEHGHVFCEHSGGLHGVSSEGAFLKGEQYSFVVLCNEGDCDVKGLLWALYNYILELPLGQEHHWLHPVGRDFSEPELLVGSYVGHEGIPVTVRVYLENGALMAEKGGETFRMLYCGETWFILFDEEGKRKERLRFFFRDGKAWGVQVYTRIFQRAEV